MRLHAIILLVCFGLVGASFPGIRIIENTSKKFTFEWTTDNFRIVQGVGAPTSVSFAGANVDLGDNGEPVIPAYSLYVGVPRQGAVSVRLAATATHGEPLTRPLRLRIAPGLGPRYPGLHFTDPWISDPQYVQFGRLRSGSFIIRPVFYDKESNTIRVLDKAQCTIEFPPAAQAPAAQVPSKSDYGHMLKRLILNYQVAAGWTAASGMPKRTAVKEFPLNPSQNMISFRVGDGHNSLPAQPFPEGTIDENGIIRIMASDIVRFLGSAPPMDQVALYASYKGAMPTDVPELAQLPDGVSEVPLLRFDVNKNGLADSSDYFLAYVSSISDWLYDTSSSQYFYKIDPYDDYRHYWITVKKSSALTLTKMGPITGAADDTLTTCKGHCYLKKSVWPSASQGIDGGLEWAWVRLNYYMPNFTIDNIALPNIDPAAACSVQVAVGFNKHAPPLGITLGSTAVCQACQYNGWYPVTAAGNQPLTLTILPNAKDDTLELKNVEFRYTQKLDMSSTSAMTVFSPERPGIVRYRLGGLSGDLVYIVRIANNDASMALVDTVRATGTFEWSDTAGIGVRYYLCRDRDQGVRPAPQMEPVAPKSSSDFTVRNLRTLSDPIDYLIVTHPNFIVQAQRLARHKRNIGRYPHATAISIRDIYDQFSGGNTDPAALRNALEYVQNQVSTSFEYVVLMGLGHYDYRNIATPDTSFIPVAIFRDKCLEDFFVYLQLGENPESALSTPDCFLGRIPCQTAQTAAQVVDKIIQTEDPTFADYGGWRNRVILVADDDMQGLIRDQLGTQHMEASEVMDTVIEHLQPAVDMRKVYLFEYEWNSLHEKPEASQAIINGINNGAAIVNYFGHGSAECWADEHILLPENIGNMQNDGQYPLISSFSCAVGKFDQPGKKRSLAEYLVLAAKSAAIATISAMREAYASDNQKLAANFFSSVFDTSDTAARTLGEAMALAKSQSRDENQKVYSYLGDPSIQTLRPARKVSLSITDNGGKALDTIKAFMLVTVKGAIMQSNGTPDAQFGTVAKPAHVLISMFNPAFITWRKDNGQNLGLGLSYASYKMPGAPIFAGQAQVVNGTFEQRILMPKNVTFDLNGANLTAYAWDGPVVALGNKKDFLFHGFDKSSVTDTTGPTISVRPVYKSGSADADASAGKGASFTDRLTAPLPLTIEIMLFDSNGIDIVSTGPDEGLTFEVPGVVARKNINYKFQFSQGDYRRGEAGWTFNEGTMSPGTYTIQVSSQDLLGNASRKSIALEITAPLELALYHVFNYPNPMRMGDSCRFYFDLSKTVNQSVEDRVKVSIRLFTLSGRLVRVFNDVKRGEVFNGKDNFNNRLSPGVYLYQMIAEDKLQQKVVKSKIEKLAINPPR
jgi:hypothetical protein